MTQLSIPQEFSRAHVLIADDDPTNRLILRGICEKLGIGLIDEAENGLEALRIIERFQPDLLLLDIRMPQLDGFGVMQHLRATPEQHTMAILVQTGLQDTADRLRCFDLGASDVVSRPFDHRELTARLRAHLRSVMAARVLFDFRTRIQAHLEITQAFLEAALPSRDHIAVTEQKFGLKFSQLYQPHDEIGGDLWTLRHLENGQLAVVLIDASAHGLAGAINALRMDCLVQQFSAELVDPAQFLMLLDRAMAKISFGQLFAGALALTYDPLTHAIRFAGSGLPAPVLWHKQNTSELACAGLPLGSGLLELKAMTVSLMPDAALLLYSDGWSDALPQPVTDYLASKNHAAPDLAHALKPTTTPYDDMTLIGLRRKV